MLEREREGGIGKGEGCVKGRERGSKGAFAYGQLYMYKKKEG